MLVNKLKQSKPSGFTIIEVMIVLGIAAAIMLIVLIAIPQLQRNQRNTARKDIAGRISTEIQNYAGNNNGNLPAATAAGFGNNITVANSFANRYLTNVNINDPRVGAAFTFIFTGTPAVGTGNTPGTVLYQTSMLCSGEMPDNTGASARNYALQMALEGGSFFCLDNR